MAGQFIAQFLLGGGAGDQDAGGGGGDEGGNLRHQAVADGEEGEALQGLVDGHALLHDADGKAAQHIDEGDENGGDGVAADEFARAVHRAVEIGFLLDFAAAAAGLGFVDDAGVEFGINRHLLAGHGVEGEPRGDFGDAARALGDDDEIDQHQNQEYDQADDIIAAHDEIAEGLDDVARVAIEQNQPGGGDIEGQPIERHEQQQGGKAGELGGFLDVKDERRISSESAMLTARNSPGRTDGSAGSSAGPCRTTRDQDDIALLEQQGQAGFGFGLRHELG